MSVPKVFISYSHDSQQHKRWVLDLATMLRDFGIDAVLDQWELGPGDDLPHFMETNLANCDRVVMVCTEKYVEKANSGAGGVGYEKMIITAELIKTIDSNKVVPIIRQQGGHLVPTFLKSKLFVDLSQDNQFEFGFDELVRNLHGAPLFVKPPIGDKPFPTTEHSEPELQVDALKELLRSIVRAFEKQAHDFINYGELIKSAGMSRLLLDIQIEEAKQQGLITQDGDNDVRLTSKGKQYALHHKLFSQ